VWVECRVTTLCGCSAELLHCVGAVQSYHILWVQCRVPHCVGGEKLSHCVGGVQSYHIMWVECRVTTFFGWRAVITLCKWSAELSYYVGGMQSYHIVWVQAELSHCVGAVQL